MKFKLKKIVNLTTIATIVSLTVIACAQTTNDNASFITLAIKDDLDPAEANSSKSLVPLVQSYNKSINDQKNQIKELESSIKQLESSSNQDALKLNEAKKQLQDLQTMQNNVLPVRLVRVGTNFGNLYELTNKSLAVSKIGPYNITLSYPSTASLIASYGRQLNLKSNNPLFNVDLKKYSDNFVSINKRIFGANPEGNWFVPFQGTSEHLIFNRLILNQIIHEIVTNGGATFNTKNDKDFFLKHFSINSNAYNDLTDLSKFPQNLIDETEIAKLYPKLTTKNTDLFDQYKLKANVFEQFSTFFDFLVRVRKAWPQNELRPYLLGEDSIANTFFMNAFTRSDYDYNKFLFYNDPQIKSSLNYKSMFENNTLQSVTLKNTFTDFQKLLDVKALYLKSNKNMAYAGTNYMQRLQPFLLDSTATYPYLKTKQKDEMVISSGNSQKNFVPQYWVYKKPTGAKTDVAVFLRNSQTQEFKILWNKNSSETSDLKIENGTSDNNFTNDDNQIANQPIGAFVNEVLKNKIITSASTLSSKFSAAIKFGDNNYYFLKNTDFTYGSELKDSNSKNTNFRPQEFGALPAPAKNSESDTKSTFMWQGPGLIGVSSPNEKNNNATRLFLKWFTTQTGNFNIPTEFNKETKAVLNTENFKDKLPSEVYTSVAHSISTTKINLAQNELKQNDPLLAQTFNSFKNSSTLNSNVIAYTDPADKQAGLFRNAINSTFGLLISQNQPTNYELFIQQLKKAGF